ncbi:MAG: glycosyltransferase family 2 protein, partial [Pseudomonadota bacterium]
MSIQTSHLPRPFFQPQFEDSTVELSILMPCLNEAETLGSCIKKALLFLHHHQINGEVIVADNGSTDGSQEIARNLGARVVDIKEKGYGAALSGGIRESRGQYVIMGDSDDSYDFSNLMPFVAQLRRGYDLVLGNRFQGGIEKGAMPFLHRYLGNPVLSNIGKIFFGSPCGDFHCGLRGFSKESIKRLNLVTQGMEFASEMVVKATLHQLKIAEVPTTLAPDGRSRPPHLRTWRDGWRHLKFLLLYCPRWLFLYPGMVLSTLGVIFFVFILKGPLQIGHVTFDVHTLIYAASAIVVGFQAMIYAIFAEA